MGISTAVAMDADGEVLYSFFFCSSSFFLLFFPLDQTDRTTGSPDHRHAFYRVKRRRTGSDPAARGEPPVPFCYV